MNCKICDKIFNNPNKHIQNCEESNHEMKYDEVETSMNKPFCMHTLITVIRYNCLLCNYSWYND